METVKSCAEFKKWNDKPVYKVELSNGKTGESFQLIPEGTPVSDLEITPNGNYADKIKLIKKNGFAGGRPAAPKGNESFALSYAKDYGIAMIGQGKEFKTDHIIQLADKFYNWLEGKKK